jgi:hypothetical protein
MPGPTRNSAKVNSRAHRGNTSGGLRILPPECDLPVPPLPKSRQWSPDERKRWKRLWTGPQANCWDDSFIDMVAAFIVHGTAVMAGSAAAWQGQEFRHLGDKLGLSPAGMAALGWVIDE